MKHNYSYCPRCGSRWEFRVYKNICAGRCGMERSNYAYGIGYTIDIGPYNIYWAYWDDGTEHCSLTYSGDTIFFSDHLPFDVSLDMIKMLVTFS